MLLLLLVTFIDLFVPLFTILLILRVVMSYVMRPDGRLFMGLVNVTEPVLAPLRRVLPRVPGIDLAPLAALFLLQGLQLLVDSLVLR